MSNLLPLPLAQAEEEAKAATPRFYNAFELISSMPSGSVRPLGTVREPASGGNGVRIAVASSDDRGKAGDGGAGAWARSGANQVVQGEDGMNSGEMEEAVGRGGGGVRGGGRGGGGGVHKCCQRHIRVRQVLRGGDPVGANGHSLVMSGRRQGGLRRRSRAV